MIDSDRTSSGRLVLPSLRAHMGDWIYYISFMKMKDLAKRVSPAHSLYSSQTLQELLQRQVLPGRARKIARYLEEQKQRFFNALVIGTYGGDPKWREVRVEQRPIIDEIELPSDLEGVLGFLTLDGTEKLFAIDGQHRVEGMRLAVKNHPKLWDEEISVILVKGITGQNRAQDQDGFERTRRLFTTLNRYAKPVNKKDTIALDEDDAVAIVTRRLVEEYSLFSDKKISIKGATSIPLGDRRSFTSINALYDGLDISLRDMSKAAWRDFKRLYPSEEKVRKLYQQALQVWDIYCKYFSPLQEVKSSGPDDFVAAKYRNPEGGHLLFRPIGLLMSLRVVRHLMEIDNLDLEKAVGRISKMPMELSGEPWAYLLWNPKNKKMIIAHPNQKAALELFIYGVGGDLNLVRSSPDKLRKDLADILNKEENEINLEQYHLTDSG